MTDTASVGQVLGPVSPAAAGPAPAAVVMLGRSGVEREAVEILLRTAGLDVIDLTRLEAAAREGEPPPVVAVLVEPTTEDWRQANAFDARIVVVLDGPPSDDRTLQLILGGADAVLHAGVEVERLVAAVRVVGLGSPSLGAAQARVLVDRLRAGRGVTGTPPRLTRREDQILRSIERGESLGETAAGLGVTAKTVQNLQSRLFRKLEARNRAQAVARAYELGLVEGAPS